MDIGADMLMVKHQIIFDFVVLLFLVGGFIKLRRHWERIRLMDAKGMEAVERLCVLDRKIMNLFDCTIYTNVLPKKNIEEFQALKEERAKAEAFYKETHPGFNFSL